MIPFLTKQVSIISINYQAQLLQNQIQQMQTSSVVCKKHSGYGSMTGHETLPHLLDSCESSYSKDQYYKPDSAIMQLPKNTAIFDALFMAINGLASVNLRHQDESVLILSSKRKYVHLKTQ